MISTEINSSPFKEQIFETFWKKGLGHSFLEWTGAHPELSKFQHYDALFYSYDQIMDDIISTAMDDKSLGKIMRSINKGESYDDFPNALKDEITKMGTDPEWLDRDLLNAGARLSQRTGLAGLLVLRNFSLMGGYYFSNLTKPLVATGALEKGPTHRLYYTLQFWIDVSRTTTNTDALRINSCLRTRIMHSVSRLSILNKNPDWNMEDLGVPINIVDMIATNIGFSFYYLYGLNQLKFKYSEQEEKGLFHLWKYVTWLLGVPAEYSPNNKKEACEFFYYWTSKQNAPDDDSRKLVKALMEEHTPISLLKYDFIKKHMPKIHRSVSNYLLDEDLKKTLNIPEVNLQYILIPFIKIKNRFSALKDQEKLIGKGDSDQQSVLNDFRNKIKGHP